VKKEYPEAFNKNEQGNLVNKQLMQNAGANKFAYINLSEKLKDRNGKLDVKYAETDGLHLNNLGYQVWIKLLRAKKYLS
jgi:lysophospholipase L1-like esterase